jgi:integrase
MKYKPSRDIPLFARELKTLSPSKIRDHILLKRNEKVTPESITMWFKRHPDVYEQLSKELVEGLPSAKDEVNPSIFQNGQFENLESVRNWINEMKDRDLSKDIIQSRVNALKRVCMGYFRNWNIDLVKEGLWCYKHPDRLTLEECRELIRILKDKGVDTHGVRMPLRDFLQSKGYVVGKKIAGGKPRGYGKFADLKVPEPTLDKMLEELKTINYEAYLVDKFMYKTGTRINATLNILLKDFEKKDTHVEVKVFDKARRSMLHTEEEIKREGKRWIKFIDHAFYNELMEFAQKENRTEKLFKIDRLMLAKINRDLIQKYCPYVLEKYGDVMPNHFWRHMFAQINLDRTQWNYSVVAFLGGWDVKSLQESYGKPPEEKLREWGIQHISMVIK